MKLKVDIFGDEVSEVYCPGQVVGLSNGTFSVSKVVESRQEAEDIVGGLYVKCTQPMFTSIAKGIIDDFLSGKTSSGYTAPGSKVSDLSSGNMSNTVFSMSISFIGDEDDWFKDSESPTADQVTDITIKDPDTGLDIAVSIFKHANGGMFGIDRSYLENTDEVVFCPFTGRILTGADFDPSDAT